MHKSADRLKTQTPTFHCVQASPFIPRQTRSPFTPIESRPFPRDPRFFRFVESSYTQYLTRRETEREREQRQPRDSRGFYLAVSVFPERWNSKEEDSPLRVACWRCTWAGHHIERERERKRPSSPFPRTMLHLGPWIHGNRSGPRRVRGEAAPCIVSCPRDRRTSRHSCQRLAHESFHLIVGYVSVGNELW